ncbi:TlpA family protein disulfide reductase [bacterium]|nr:TlpA family protein disulfide reductase [bacterium]
MKRILILTVLMLLAAVPAQAYTPNVGDRANDISGRDVVNGGVAQLSDHMGKWVFLDFWAGWCGPCIGELPNMLTETRRVAREYGNFQVFGVSLDADSTTNLLHKYIKQHKIDYPVTYDGGGWDTVQSKEWDIHSIPATFLINPQGVIVATNLRGEKLGPALDFFLGNDGDYMPIGLSSSATDNGDGSVGLSIDLFSPDHKALRYEVDYYHVKYEYAEDDPNHERRPVSSEYIELDEENSEISESASFGEFGDRSFSHTIPAVEGTAMMGYTVRVMLPGTEDMFDGEGLWVSDSGRIRFNADK